MCQFERDEFFFGLYFPYKQTTTLVLGHGTKKGYFQLKRYFMTVFFNFGFYFAEKKTCTERFEVGPARLDI